MLATDLTLLPYSQPSVCSLPPARSRDLSPLSSEVHPEAIELLVSIHVLTMSPVPRMWQGRVSVWIMIVMKMKREEATE